MIDPTDTINASQSGINTSKLLAEERPALLIAWSTEPDRVGEVVPFDASGGAFILGRGDAAATDCKRLRFYRQRPGGQEPAPPLTSPGLSREQLRIRLEGRGLHVERIGKCAMEVCGERVERADLEPGDTLLVKGQLLLFCTRRGYQIPPLRSASLPSAQSFGMPDDHGIVGESPALWLLREKLAWLGQADAHTLVLGESGSGKELCARAVHAHSARARGPFVARNAATIPESIIDAELFGNVKGYPNPGMPDRPGIIGAADGGTLFLDEIGELPQRLQANLLRVLDEGGEYHRLGGSTAMRSRFRLLGATNRDPDALKHDLAARLVLRLEVPGLEARRDDIPLLVRHLLRRAATKSPEATRPFLASPAGSPPDLRTKASLIEHLLRHRYTTHLRELDALLWRAMAMSKGDAIEWCAEVPQAAPSRVTPRVVRAAVRGRDDVPAEAEAEPRPAAREPSEAEIRERLAEHAGNVVRTAQALGLSSRYVLYRLMRKYGIEGD